MVLDGFTWFFQLGWLVFHSSRLVFHSSRSFFMVPGQLHDFFKIPGWFSWFKARLCGF